MPRKYWVFNPHAGGTRIPEAVKARTKDRLLRYAREHLADRCKEIVVRFHGPLCYIDAHIEPGDVPTHLCRLRYFGQDGRWSLAYYTYSHEKYEPSVFPSGEFHGAPEEALQSCRAFL